MDELNGFAWKGIAAEREKANTSLLKNGLHRVIILEEKKYSGRGFDFRMEQFSSERAISLFGNKTSEWRVAQPSRSLGAFASGFAHKFPAEETTKG
jgi:hypothetical protein